MGTDSEWSGRDEDVPDSAINEDSEDERESKRAETKDKRKQKKSEVWDSVRSQHKTIDQVDPAANQSAQKRKTDSDQIVIKYVHLLLFL